MSTAELEDAIRFRTDFGLRADEAWILLVAADPSSDKKSYGVPLSSAEVAELQRRIRDVEQVKAAVITYGEQHLAEWGGAYVDHQAGGVLVAQFTANVELHRLALLAQVSPFAKLEVRGVQWTEAELEAAKARVKEEEDWFATVPARIRSIGIDTSANRVVIAVSSPNPNASKVVLAHFPDSEDWLQVSSDGTGALLLAPGSIDVNVVDGSGRPVVGLRCVAYPDLPGASDPKPDPVPLTDETGTCHLDVRATGYWVVVERDGEGGEVVGTARTVVPAGESVALEIVI